MGEADLKIFWILEGGDKAILSLKDLVPEEILSIEELARWKAMRFEKRRSEFLLGRYTAKRLLRTLCPPGREVPFQSLEIGNEPEGAPYLKHPEHPGSLSLSHREGVAAAAYCPGAHCQVGIDLEYVEPREWSFVEDFFTDAEIHAVRNTSESKQPLLVTVLWSAKEAVLKAWRKGLRLDTRMVEIISPTEEELGSMAFGWIPLEMVSREPSFPRCQIFAGSLGKIVLTLAHTSIVRDKQVSLIEIN
jgi:4'-phosphopantetheinyl transferase